MNHNTAKVPDSDDTHWEFIDVFLFRNGEHAVPPRKYHLKYEELANWEKTLKNIAQIQYGTKQSAIELYKINGEKVTTPIEISNKNFYVTVPPQDTFIPAGYNDYILKASRSREKRLGKIKKPVNGALPEPEVKEDAKRKLPKNETADETNISVEILPSTQGNVLEGKTQRRLLNDSSRTPIISSSHKKKNPPSPIVPKASIKKTDNSSKKNLKVSTGRIVSKDPIPTNLSNSFKTKNKEITRIGKFNSLVNPPKKNETNPEIVSEVQYTPTIIDENDTTADNPVIDDVICDKELIVVKNPDSVVLDTNKSSLSRPIAILSDLSSLHLLEENRLLNKSTTDMITNGAENIYKPDLAVYKVEAKPKKSEVDNNSLIDKSDPHDTNYSAKINQSQSTDHIIAIIDKGDVVDFNLKLELKKCSGVINTQYSLDNKMHTLAENPSQPEGDVLETKANELEGRNTKIVIIQCSCCGTENYNELFHKIETSAYSDDKKFVVFVPHPVNEENIESCSCDQKPNLAQLSIVSPPKKVNADTSIMTITTKATTDVGTAEELQTVDIRTQSILQNNPSMNQNKVQTNDSRTKTSKDKAFDATDFKTLINDDKASRTLAVLQNNPSLRDNKQVTTNNSQNMVITTQPSPSIVKNSSVIQDESMKTPVNSQYSNITSIEIENNSNQKKTSSQPIAADINKSFGVKDESLKSRVNSVHSNTTEREIQNTESFNLRKNASNMSKPFMDNSTQTEWDTLLVGIGTCFIAISLIWRMIGKAVYCFLLADKSP